MPVPPSIRLTSATPGFDNVVLPKKGAKQAPPQAENLLKKAVEFASDGEISDADLEQLTKIANSDGDMEVSEALLLDELGYVNIVGMTPGDKTFVDQVLEARKNANFDPNTFVFTTDNILSIDGAKLPDGQDSDITLRFSNERINGGPRNTFTANQEDLGKAARESLQQLIATPATDANLKAAAKWSKIDKFDLDAVRKFLQSRNFNPAEQAQFAQKYLQGYYDHTGVGGDWGGISDIQKQLKHLPVDGGGRKFIECEAFSAITQKLFPGTQAYTVRDATGPEDADGARNHQVSVIRIGDQRFVQSNDTIQEITAQQLPANSPAVKDLSDEQLIASFDEKGARPLTRAAKDVTPLAESAEVYDIGEVINTGHIEVNPHIPNDPDYKAYPNAELRVLEKIDDFNLRVEGAVSKKPFILRFDPQNNRKFLIPNPPTDAISGEE